MKKLLIIALITVVSTVCMVSNSYGEQEPQYGGHLKILVSGFQTPKTIGYFPKMSFADAVAAPTWSERLLDLKTTGDFAPSVAKGYEMSPDLKAMGFSVVQAPTVYHAVYCDSNDPASPFTDKKVREAIEYAIDRKAMAEAVGFGFQIPVYQPTHEGTAGYNPDYPVRAYNPEKAKQLLAEAGYAKGIKTKMIAQATGTYQAGALVVQNFLAEIGIDVELDLCDVGRFWGSVMGGWKGLLFGPFAFNPEFCVAWLHTLGPEPIMRFASMAKSEKYLDLCERLVVAPDKTAMRKLTQEMVTQAGLDCMFIPCTLNYGTSVHVANFHTGYYTALDWTYWLLWDDWMEKK